MQELGERNGTVSSSRCRVIAALLFPCLQLQRICLVIEKEDLCLLHVLGDTDLTALQEMTRIWHSGLFLENLKRLLWELFYLLSSELHHFVHYHDHVWRPRFKPNSWYLIAA